MLSVDDHELLDLGAFVTNFPGDGGMTLEPLMLPNLLAEVSATRFDSDTQTAVRDLLRLTGFKPSGRSKPASEYLQKAIPAGKLGAINAAVDTCNACSYAFGLPISVVDLDRTEGALRVGVASPGTSYVFNASGQEIRLDGLLCLFDALGPCANPVKDSQRTKTHPGTVTTLSLVWGTKALADRTEEAVAWYRKVLESAGASTSQVPFKID